MVALGRSLFLLLKGDARLTSPLLVIGIVGVGILLLYSPKLARAGRRWLIAWLFIYWFLSTPLGSGVFAGATSWGFEPLGAKEEARDANAIVLLGGGIQSYLIDDLALDDLDASAIRVLEAARLYRLLGGPVVIVSGGNTNDLTPPRPEGNAFKAALLQLGVPRERIIVDNRSLTTRQQALTLKPVLESLGIHQFVLVTSATHMRRSMRVFESAGMRPIASPAPLETDRRHALLFPSRRSLLISDRAFYDCAALGYYYVRGWLRVAPALTVVWPFPGSSIAAAH